MQESLCEISRWFREEQEKELGDEASSSPTAKDEDDDADDTDDAEERVNGMDAHHHQTHIADSEPSSRDAWTPVLVQPTYGPCNRCYPRNLKFSPNSHVTPPPTPPEERDKFECLYLLVDTAISRMECERGKPWK